MEHQHLFEKPNTKHGIRYLRHNFTVEIERLLSRAAHMRRHLKDYQYIANDALRLKDEQQVIGHLFKEIDDLELELNKVFFGTTLELPVHTETHMVDAVLIFERIMGIIPKVFKDKLACMIPLSTERN